MADWWDKGKKIPVTDSGFQKIVGFYVFMCPVELMKVSKKDGNRTNDKVSRRAVTFSLQGWTGARFKTLLAAMKRTASKQVEFRDFCANEDLEAATASIEKNSSLKDANFEMIAFKKRDGMSQASAIFYGIRNALAHGSFSVVGEGAEKTYYLQSDKNGKVQSRIRLREKTLLKWIDDFNETPTALREAMEADRRPRKKNRGA